MKVETRAARKYAGALFQVASGRDRLEPARLDLAEVARLTEAQPELLDVMKQPRIRVEQKQALVRKLFAGQVDELTFDFLLLLTGKRRFGLIEAIQREFARLLDEHRKILPVQATTAVPLPADQAERLRQRLAEVTGYDIQLTTVVDPAMLGGLKLRLKGKLIDGSVANQLRRMREQWKQTRVAAG